MPLTGILLEKRDLKTQRRHREEVQIIKEAKVEVMLPHAKEYQAFVAIAQKLEEARKDSFLEIL